jgi:hypothetical protein
MREPEDAPRPRLTRRAIIVLVSVMVAAILVAVVGVGFAITQAGRSVPTASPAPEKTPTSAPTPTPEAADRPHVRFDVECADLVPAESVTALIGTSRVAPGPTDTLAELGVVEYIQVGAVRCDWAGAGYNHLSVILLPDAAEALTAYLPSLAMERTVTGHTAYVCDVSTTVAYCAVDALVDGTWVAASVYSETPDGVASAFEQLAQSLTAGVPLPSDLRWTPPASPLTQEAMLQLEPQLIEATFALPGAQPAATDMEGVAGEVYHRADASWLSWYDPTMTRSVALKVVPGAGWAAAELAARPGATRVSMQNGADASVISVDQGGASLWRACARALDALVCVDTAEASGQSVVAQLDSLIAQLPSEG